MDKEYKLLAELIAACGYDINQIEDEYDFMELCEDIKLKVKLLADCPCYKVLKYKQALDEIGHIE